MDNFGAASSEASSQPRPHRPFGRYLTTVDAGTVSSYGLSMHKSRKRGRFKWSEQHKWHVMWRLDVQSELIVSIL